MKRNIKLTIEIINGDEIDLLILAGSIEHGIKTGKIGDEIGKTCMESGRYITGTRFNWRIEAEPFHKTV